MGNIDLSISLLRILTIHNFDMGNIRLIVYCLGENFTYCSYRVSNDINCFGLQTNYHNKSREFGEMDQDVNSLISKLNKIGIALSAEHNLSRLLEMIVRELRSFTNSDGGSLYIRVDDELSFEVAQNDTFTRRMGNVPFKSFKLPIDHKSIAGYVASTGKILNIPDLGHKIIGNRVFEAIARNCTFVASQMHKTSLQKKFRDQYGNGPEK